MKGKKKNDAGTLYLRDVPQQLKDALKKRGDENARSMGAEALMILAINCGVKLG